MKIRKIINKKAALIVITAAGALIAGSAGASASRALGDKTDYTPVELQVSNYGNGCVRAYLDPHRATDIQPNQSVFFSAALARHSFAASVFRGACGGKAIKTVWHTTKAGGIETWIVH